MKHITQKIAKKSSLGLFILLIILSAKTYAGNFHRNESSLKLLLPHTSNYTIIFDNKKFHDINNCFRIGNLHQGNHRIKIVELVIRRGRIINREVVFNGVIFIPKSAKVWAKISRHGRMRIDRIIHQDYHKKSNRGNRYNNNYYEKNDDYGDDYDNKDGYNENKDNDYYDEEWSSFENQRNNKEDWDEDETQYSNNRNSSSKKSYGIALNLIKNQSFDSERLKIAKQTVKEQRLTSEQVLEITKLFSFESSRLDFAKYAYDYTTDKTNYNVVHSAFQFSSSTSELLDYISKKG